MTTVMGRSSNGRLAALALATTGFIHAVLVSEHLGDHLFLGLSFAAFAIAALALAALLVRAESAVVWAVASSLCLAATGAFIYSRVQGFPGHEHEIGYWGDPRGWWCQVAQLLVVALAVAPQIRITRRAALPLAGAAFMVALGAAAEAAPAAANHGHGGRGGHGGPATTTAGVHDADHLGAEGLRLVSAPETATSSRPRACAGESPLREYAVTSISVDIPLNRWGDHDPEGRAYVLSSQIEAVRAEEQRYAAARKGSGPVPVSTGLQGDLIQPLALRVHPGECLRITLHNDLANESTSLQLHGAQVRVGRTGRAAVAGEPSAEAHPKADVVYEWSIPKDQPQGSHYFHSSTIDDKLSRQQTAHGLYGAVIVEPVGSVWTDPTTQAEISTGWAAVITTPERKAFREFALFYSEVGDETYQPLDRHGVPLPQAESLSGAYRPGGRAINYRSEPFLDRLTLQKELTGKVDDSLSYSSYTFGDPATPIMRAYLGDPVVQRVIHAGTETAHVHHVHGGATRWMRQPGTAANEAASGLDKTPALTPEGSERTDSQSIGPSETFDVVDECGAGGCQQSAGDFMFHCHIAHHYFAGMWGIWRVYNTLQDGPHSTDDFPALPALADRKGLIRAGVDSAGLIGGPVATRADLRGWLARHLPPAGKPRGYDASVWDWTLQGDVAMGEPDTTATWANYTPRTPGKRHSVLFDPVTGKPAYPMLRPHVNRRPPFAPGHGPAPYLDPVGGRDTPLPGASGAASTCPKGTRLQHLPIRAIAVPIPLNSKESLLDPDGQLLVLQAQEAAIRADPDLRRPLTVRANAHEDCLDITLTNGLQDATDPHQFSKVSMHVHFVQFDVQGSDGVDSGFNYEQTVRPFLSDAVRLGAAAAQGTLSLSLNPPPQVGSLLGVGMERPDGFEIVEVKAVNGTEVMLAHPLRKDHAAGEVSSAEFVRYRWYPDAQVGTSFFHDHVNAILGQPRGLYGGLVVEPPGSTYSDPTSGKPLIAGPLADIHTSSPASVDVRGSFRELVTFLADDIPLTALGRDTGGNLNLRVEPLTKRPDRAAPFKGSIATPTIAAYLGDLVIFRTLVGASNEVHTFHVDGSGFRVEPWSMLSPLTNAVPVGISERFDVSVQAGGPRRQPGDYLFGNGRASKLAGGSWGILRVLPGPAHAQLKPLSATPIPQPEPVCPAGARTVKVPVTALQPKLAMLEGAAGLVLVRTERKSVLPRRPLVLHVSAGDCLTVDLVNETDRAISLNVDLLVQESSNAAVGDNVDRATAPGKTRSYTFYADPSLGPNVATMRDGMDPVKSSRLGFYGAVVVDPAGSGSSPAKDGVSWVVRPHGGKAYRDFTLFMHDGDAAIGTHRMPYTKNVDGVAAMSYGSSTQTSTVRPPELRAYAGEDVVMHVLAPSSEQTQVFSLEGHSWPVEPGREGTNRISAATIGGQQTLTLRLDGGAGGREKLSGDFRYLNARLPYQAAGMWGVLHVLDKGEHVDGLAALAGSGSSRRWLVLVAVAVAIIGVFGLWIRRRARR